MVFVGRVNQYYPQLKCFFHLCLGKKKRLHVSSWIQQYFRIFLKSKGIKKRFK